MDQVAIISHQNIMVGSNHGPIKSTNNKTNFPLDMERTPSRIFGVQNPPKNGNKGTKFGPECNRKCNTQTHDEPERLGRIMVQKNMELKAYCHTFNMKMSPSRVVG